MLKDLTTLNYNLKKELLLRDFAIIMFFITSSCKYPSVDFIPKRK